MPASVYIPQGRNIFPDSERAPQSRARRRRLGAIGRDAAAPSGSDHADVPDASGARPPRRPRPCPAASRKCSKSRAGCCSIPTDPDRRTVDRPIPDDGAGRVRDPERPARQGRYHLLIEQNARQALQISDYGLVLEQGQTRIEDTAAENFGRSAHRTTVSRWRPRAAGVRVMTKRRILVGLIGRNIQGSLSPALFADAFEAAGIDGYYHLIDVDRMPGRRLPQLLEAIKSPALPAPTSPIRSSRTSFHFSMRSIRKPRKSARSIPLRSRRTAAPPATISIAAAGATVSRRPRRR